MQAATVAAVDIGGTFTDAVTFDLATGRLTVAKALTTHDALDQGVLHALQKARQSDVDNIRELRHGSTIVINALIERSGARVALVTTSGFEDVLFIGRGNVPEPYTLRYRRLPAYLDRRDVFGIAERTTAFGEIENQPANDEIAALAERVLAGRYAAVAVCFLNSYQNPTNERHVAALLRMHLPAAYVSASTDVSREWHEWSRASTAIMNAYVGPVVRSYLASVQSTLQQVGPVERVLATDSTGGLMSIDRAIQCPIYMVESGPASGAMAAIQVGAESGSDRVITFDMGGTTAKSALAVGGQLATVPLYWVNGYQHGWPAQCNTVDIVEIGAGGGSIAWMDDVGALHVGPRSAGSMPGPACYGGGGVAPTITDAHVHLGHIPTHYAGSQIELDRDLATQAIARLADRLGIETDRLAQGILDIADNHMASMLRTLVARRGYDPRDFTLVAYGGSGPLHASALARELHIKKVLVPARAGVFSAFGMLLSDLRVDRAEVFTEYLTDDAIPRMQAAWMSLQSDLSRDLESMGEPGGAIRFVRSIDGRYRGQDHVINVLLPDAVLDAGDVREHFNRVYEQLYGHCDTASDLQLTVIRLSAFKAVDRPPTGQAPAPQRTGSAQLDGYLLRNHLQVGDVVEGPRIVVEEGATTRLLPGDRATVLNNGDLLVEPDDN